MAYEFESEYTTSYYHCIDPIENFKIKVILKPLKNFVIPLPQFDVDHSSDVIQFSEESNQEEIEEYIFQWQEKIFNKLEIKKHRDPIFRKKAYEKYHNISIKESNQKKKYPQKLFTYVDVDNYTIGTSHSKTSVKKSSSMQKTKNFGNTPKTKIIDYYPSHDRKNEHNEKYIQKMFIMIDLGLNNDEIPKENYDTLCILNYNTSSKLLEMTPSFSKSELKPYVIGLNNQDSRNSFYYWLIHVSSDISTNSLRKEMEIMAKVLNHQEELKKLLVGTDFFVGQPNYLYVTLFADINSAQNFEYDNLYINYFVKLPLGWECNNSGSLSGVTQTSYKNSQGIAHFCHLFEINFFLNLQSFEGISFSTPEIIFEVFSMDKYSRHRNEGYTYIYLPANPGMYEYTLNCWKAFNKKITSQLQRFFIGGGPELEDISYVGLCNNQKEELINRFGFETVSSGKINFKLNILHQSEFSKKNNSNQQVLKSDELDSSKTDNLLSSINAVLEAFRKARARMLEAKKGLECESPTHSHEFENNFKKTK